jgi:hypothetical protein
MMLSFQLGGILIVPDRELDDHSVCVCVCVCERERERETERESENMCLLSGAQRDIDTS